MTKYTSPNSDKALCSARESALWLYLVIHLDMDSLSPWGAPGWTGEAPASNAPQVYHAPPSLLTILLILSKYTSNSMKFHIQKRCQIENTGLGQKLVVSQ